ncbi:MAG: tetratricopeptide repeat protein [Elusimicrobiota bacterium]
MRLPAAALLLFLLAPALRAAPPAAKDEISGPLRERYDEAFKLFTDEEYVKAIQKWSEILRIAPEQRTAQTMIAEARRKLEQQGKDRLEKLYALVGRGLYDDALLDVQNFIEEDFTNPVYRTLQQRLEELVKVAPRAGAGKAWTLAMKGISAALARRPDLRLAHNALRYACELAPEDRSIAALKDLLLNWNPELVGADPITPGMRFLAFKRFVALNFIYDGKYDLAIQALGDILQLEPDDLLSLKRLGSAYFSLGQRPQARAAWKRALTLSPGDPKLVEFLRKLDLPPPSGAVKAPEDKVLMDESPAPADAEEGDEEETDEADEPAPQ